MLRARSRAVAVLVVLTMCLRPDSVAEAVACGNGGELSEDGSACTCLDGFRGPDCNSLVDFCETEDVYNAKCAPGACVPIYSGFYCSRCRDAGMQGMHCQRAANDSTPTAAAPYVVFLPKVALFEDLPLLVSLTELGQDLVVKVRWGDGAVDERSAKDFFSGYLVNEVPSFGLDSLAPGTPGYAALPRGRRHMLRLKHQFNRHLSAKGIVKNYLQLINRPENKRGVEMQHDFQLKVVLPPEQDRTVDLSVPELGSNFAADDAMPHWSRLDTVQVLGEAQDSVSLGAAVGYTFTFGLTLRIGTSSQLELPAETAPDMRYLAPPHTLPIGKHCLKFAAWNGTRLVEFVTGYFLVVPAPLQVLLLGGRARIVSPRYPLVLDASKSMDLNEKDLRHVRFQWRCSRTDAADGGHCPFQTATGKRVVVPPGLLRHGHKFIVVLEASRRYLDPVVVRQAVTVDDNVPVNVAIV